MSYAKNYLQSSDLADQILSQARSGQSPSSGLASRRSGRPEQKKLDIDPTEGFSPSGVSSMRNLFTEARAEMLPGFELERDTGLEVDLAPEESLLPEARPDPKAPKSPAPKASSAELPKSLKEDAAFNASVAKLQERYPGLSTKELYLTIKGESRFDPKATNKYNMAGLLQISPESAKRLGTSKKDILAMSPAEQIDLYGDYLGMWNYTSEMPLAIMQAAPAYAKRSSDSVVYKKGTKAWTANPGWRPEGGGDITIQSIKDYYK